MPKDRNEKVELAKKATSIRKGCLKSCVDSKKPIKKVLVRDCEVPIKGKTEVGLPCVKLTSCDWSSDNIPLNDGDISENLNANLCTTLKIAEDIKKIKNLSGLSQKASSSKSTLKTTAKTQKKINIPFEEQVYKDLIDLRVNDEDIGIPSTFPIKPREIIKNKDPEPVLTDYFKPTYNIEYIVKSDVPTYQVEKEWNYNGFSVSKAMTKWDLF